MSKKKKLYRYKVFIGAFRISIRQWIEFSFSVLRSRPRRRRVVVIKRVSNNGDTFKIATYQFPLTPPLERKIAQKGISINHAVQGIRLLRMR